MKTFKQFLNENHIRNMESNANKKDVHLRISSLDRNTWHLEGITRKSDKKGTGASVMKDVVKKADEHKKHIVLYPTHKKLYDYYEKFGFKKFKKIPLEKHEYMDNNGMIREPKKK